MLYDFWIVCLTTHFWAIPIYAYIHGIFLEHIFSLNFLIVIPFFNLSNVCSLSPELFWISLVVTKKICRLYVSYFKPLLYENISTQTWWSLNSNISWMYCTFVKSILHNFQIFEDFICTLLLLISNLILLWPNNIH